MNVIGIYFSQSLPLVVRRAMRKAFLLSLSLSLSSLLCTERKCSVASSCAEEEIVLFDFAGLPMKDGVQRSKGPEGRFASFVVEVRHHGLATQWMSFRLGGRRGLHDDRQGKRRRLIEKKRRRPLLSDLSERRTSGQQIGNLLQTVVRGSTRKATR